MVAAALGSLASYLGCTAAGRAVAGRVAAGMVVAGRVAAGRVVAGRMGTARSLESGASLAVTSKDAEASTEAWALAAHYYKSAAGLVSSHSIT